MVASIDRADTYKQVSPNLATGASSWSLSCGLFVVADKKCVSHVWMPTRILYLGAIPIGKYLGGAADAAPMMIGDGDAGNNKDSGERHHRQARIAAIEYQCTPKMKMIKGLEIKAQE